MIIISSLTEHRALRSSQVVLQAIRQIRMEQHAARVTKGGIQSMSGRFKNAFHDSDLIRFCSFPDAAPLPRPANPDESSRNNKDGELLWFRSVDHHNTIHLRLGSANTPCSSLTCIHVHIHTRSHVI
mmetsp:Transcript_3536/g.9400  ORF Transcript_3536/g.9400 Transcript_3536/m.9400 type:complete len:127 (-) Transcript_3536:1740-2120(-)